MSFERDVQLVERGLVEGVSSLMVEVAFSMLQALVFASPVGDPNLWQSKRAPPGYAGGRFRGNWTGSIGQEDTVELDVTDKGGGATLSRGRAALAGYKLGPKIFLQNNTPYAARLNDGHSRQAPAGFVERAIQTGIENLDGRGDIFL